MDMRFGLAELVIIIAILVVIFTTRRPRRPPRNPRHPIPVQEVLRRFVRIRRDRADAWRL
jgi:hypothetical protein